MLWIQLLGPAVMPLEALLLLLLLAGSDPGPLPGLERVLCWAIGSLAPAFLLWRRPADPWSLLLVQVPLRARRPLQQQLSALQETPLLRAGLVLGSGISLALLWWIDGHAALASAFSPLAGSPRLVALLLAAALLALLLWQWQQLLQALWLLSRPPGQLSTREAMLPDEVGERRLPLGLPLLLLDPLRFPEAADGQPLRPEEPTPPASAEAAARLEQPESPTPASETSARGDSVAVEPEQSAADQQGDALDQQIP